MMVRGALTESGRGQPDGRLTDGRGGRPNQVCNPRRRAWVGPSYYPTLAAVRLGSAPAAGHPEAQSNRSMALTSLPLSGLVTLE